MIGASQEGFAAGLGHGIADLGGVGCDHDRAAIGLDGPAPDMHDHRLAGDIRQGLIGEPCGFEPRRYNDQTRRHDLASVARDPVPATAGTRSNVSVATSG